jgi:hypothetical protein
MSFKSTAIAHDGRHPEEPAEGGRLEGSTPARLSPAAVLRDAVLRTAPQDEVDLIRRSKALH